MKRTIEAAFLDHPNSVGESYSEHFMFASRFGLKLIGAGLAAMVHGLLPFAFESTASPYGKRAVSAHRESRQRQQRLTALDNA